MDQRGEPARPLPCRERARQTSGAFPSYGRRDGTVHQGGRRGAAAPACHDRRVMSQRPARLPAPLARWAATATPPPAGWTRRAGRRRRSRPAPTGAGGTPPRRPTSPSTASTSATPTSCGAPRGCGRPTRTCSGTSPGGGCSRSAAARPPAPAGCAARGPTSWRWTSRPGMLARAAELNRATGIDVPLLQADAGALPLAAGTRGHRVLGVRRAALRRRRRGRRWPRWRGCCGRAAGSWPR